VNLDEIEDEVSKTSAEAQIMHFGQTPCQLFEKPVHSLLLSIRDATNSLGGYGYCSIPSASCSAHN